MGALAWNGLAHFSPMFLFYTSWKHQKRLIEPSHKSPIAADDGYIFEGDMVLPLEKINNAINHGDIDYTNKNAFGLKSSSYAKWKNGKVPFVLDDSVSK